MEHTKKTKGKAAEKLLRETLELDRTSETSTSMNYDSPSDVSESDSEFEFEQANELNAAMIACFNEEHQRY